LLIKESDFKDKALDHIAEDMCVAARTAPKAKGIDLIVTAIVKGDTINKLADRMLKIQKEQNGSQLYIRDAESIKQASHIVLIGTKLQAVNLKACGICGYKDCEHKAPEALCAFNPGDLGIAIGSALSVAADHRVDNRIMFSVGRAAVELGLLGPDVKMAMGIPLSVTGKNPFFDRK
jgi:uncharacterized ferredoxin-like protein